MAFVLTVLDDSGLAIEILQATQPGVWRAGWLASRRAGEALRNGRFRKWQGTQPTLIVIDCAASMSEALRDNVVRELAEEPAESRSDLPPLPILLFEREADEMRGWDDTLIHAAGDGAPELFPHSVLRLSKLDDTQRRTCLEQCWPPPGCLTPVWALRRVPI
jgi:hypothetical protein